MDILKRKTVPPYKKRFYCLYLYISLSLYNRETLTTNTVVLASRISRKVCIVRRVYSLRIFHIRYTHLIRYAAQYRTGYGSGRVASVKIKPKAVKTKVRYLLKVTVYY